LLVVTLSQEFWLEWLEQLAVASVPPSQYALSYNWHSMDVAKRSECNICGSTPTPITERVWPRAINSTELRNAVTVALKSTTNDL